MCPGTDGSDAAPCYEMRSPRPIGPGLDTGLPLTLPHPILVLLPQLGLG